MRGGERALAVRVEEYSLLFILLDGTAEMASNVGAGSVIIQKEGLRCTKGAGATPRFA